LTVQEWTLERTGGAGRFIMIVLAAAVVGFAAGLLWPPGGARAGAEAEWMPDRTQVVHALSSPAPSDARFVRPAARQASRQVDPRDLRARETADGPPRGTFGGDGLDLREQRIRDGERARARAQREALERSRLAASSRPPASSRAQAGEAEAPASRLAPAGPSQGAWAAQSAPASRTEATAAPNRPPASSGDDRPPRRLTGTGGEPMVMALDLDDPRGRVRLRLEIGADGRVHEAMVVSSEPVNTALERAAVAAARQWQYEPALRGGRPVDASVMVTVDFEPGE
jgi:TonB family protein